MNHHIFIGCDIGTSGTKAVATDSFGSVLARASATYGLTEPRPNWAEQEPDIWLDAAVSCLRSVAGQLEHPQAVKAICLSALYGGTGVMCDENFSSVRPAIIWMDRRSGAESLMLRETIGEDTFLKLTGNGVDSYFGYTKLLWVQKHEPEKWQRIRHILPIHSYIIYKLTGTLAVDYCSAANLGGIYDYSLHSWSEDMCRRLGIPFDALPQDFHAPADIIGNLSAQYQKLTGLPGPVPVCAGTVDCIASMLSAGVTMPGDNAAVLGTSLNWGFLNSRRPDNPSLISMPYCTSPKDISYTYGGSSTAGALPRWFAQNFMGGDATDIYAGLEQEIKNHNIGPGSGGLTLLPYFMGERTPIWDENATGVLFGLSLLHKRAHIYRAVLEAVAFSLRHIMESMAEHASSFKSITLVGGGARSRLWQHIFADVTGLPVLTPESDIEAPLGDAFMAAFGSGYITDYNSVRQWLTMNPPIEPDHKNHSIYNEYFELYKELYEKLKGSMAKRASLLSQRP